MSPRRNESGEAHPIPSAVTPSLTASAPSRHRIIAEILLVLGVSFGISALSSILSFVDAATRPGALGEQTAPIVTPAYERPWLDLLYQLLSFVNAVVPVALVVFLLWLPGRAPWRRLGLAVDSDRVSTVHDIAVSRGAVAATAPARLGLRARDVWQGLGLVALIGIPGLGLYLIGRSAGITLNVVPTALDAHWWTVPVLVLVAVRASLTEEIIVVAYLRTRLTELGWSVWQFVATSALLRGSYHLYQGIGPFIGNVAMGALFGWIAVRTGRIWPLLVAHLAIDLIVFLGYPLAYAWWPGLFGATGQ